MSFWRPSGNYDKLFHVIACTRALQNHGKVLEVFVASVEESADKSSLQLEGDTILKKALKLEAARSETSVTSC